MGTLSWWIEMEGPKRVHLALGYLFSTPAGGLSGGLYSFTLYSFFADREPIRDEDFVYPGLFSYPSGPLTC
jgi:hypothetical protein